MTAKRNSAPLPARSVYITPARDYVYICPECGAWCTGFVTSHDRKRGDVARFEFTCGHGEDGTARFIRQLRGAR